MKALGPFALAVLSVSAVAAATDVVTAPFPGAGVTRIHRTLTSPRTINVEILVLDLTDPRIEFLVTPGDPTFRMDYTLARTTTYVTQWGLDGAVNANFWGGGLGSEGTSRDVIGLALSDGWTVHFPTLAPTSPDPALLIREDGSATAAYVRTFNTTIWPRDRQGVSSIGYDGATGLTGTLLVTNGVNTGATTTPRPSTADPRTVAGVSQDGRTLVVAAIDGRTACSAGMTAPEAAALLLEFGVWNGVNLDGGGSTTMVLRYPGQTATIINCTTDPNYERPVANHLGFRVVPAYDHATLVAAYAFGATDGTQPVYNAPSVSYTKLRQDSGGTASIQYDPGRGYGYTSLTGLDTTPNNNGAVLDGDPIYAESIGAKGSVGTIVFRADVPNGKYRFVAAGGNVAEYNHVSRIRVRNGGGAWVNMLDHEHVDRWTIWRVGFADKVPPPADGAGHDGGATTDPKFRPLVNSPVIDVTGGYAEFEQTGRGVNTAEKWGGDLCLLELWRLDPAPADLDGDGDVDLNDYAIFVDCLGGPFVPGPGDYDADGDVDVADFALWAPCLVGPGVASGDGCQGMDLDADGDVDLGDFSRFAKAFTGSLESPLSPGCRGADFDGDHGVDLLDFAVFQAGFTG